MTPALLRLSTPARAALAVVVALLATVVPAAGADAVTGVPQAAIPSGCGELDLNDTAAVAELGREVDDVFVGRVVGVGRSFAPSPLDDAESAAAGEPQPRTVRHNVIVTAPLAGDLERGDPVRVDFVASAETDPTQLRVNRTYVLFTRDAGKVVEADACTGWVLVGDLDSRILDDLRAALAEPPPATEVDVELTANPDVDRDEPELGRIVAPGGAIALLGVLGLVLVSRIGRARP